MSGSAATASRSARTGSAPSASMRSSSMKLVNRSPIFWAFEPCSCAPSSPARASLSMIARTRASDCSASSTNEPHADRSAGISVVSSQRPFMCRNRSS